MKEHKVAITHCNEYEINKVYESIKTLVENTDFPIVQGKKVLIKPNILTDSKPEKAVTTNPVVIQALIRILKERGASLIYVGDSPGFHTSSFKADGCGIHHVIEEEKVIWADFTDKPKDRVLWHGIKAPQTRFLDECDVVISAAKMKTHQLMYTTGAVKNMFGTVPSINKSALHLAARTPESFSKLILSIYHTHTPEWAIMDGIISMEGAGPSNGDRKKTNLLLASASPISLDYAEAVVMGYNPSDIPILKNADKEEYLPITYPLLKAEDEVIKDFKRVKIKKRGLFNSLLLPFVRRLFPKLRDNRKTPVFLKEKCKHCSKCVEICPNHALTLKEDGVHIDKSKCIRCYCCHEMCPFRAIEIN